jgi:hypothetical protein
LYFICEMMDKFRDRGWDVHMVNTTHDSCTLEVPLDLAVKVDKGKTDDWNRPVYAAEGPVVDVIYEVINKGAPVEPLNRVNFKADVEYTEYWGGPPHVMYAVDAAFDTEKSKFRWDLLKPDEVLDKVEYEELMEIEAVMTGEVA